MGTHRLLFFRRYRAALLDYLLGSGETGLVRAYELGRGAIDEGLGLLQVVQAHQQAVNTVLESAETATEGFRRLTAASDFLMETLAPFEMAYRGYRSTLEGGQETRGARTRSRTSPRRRT
jgi:phosphoserine phosphatase RsbU-like protein